MSLSTVLHSMRIKHHSDNSYTRTSCMGSLNWWFFPPRNCDVDSMMSFEVFESLCLMYPKFLFLGSLFNSCVRMAVCSLTNDAAQTVANPNKDGTILVAVDTPITFCAAVDTASVVPNATHPPIIGNTASGMRVQRFPKEKSKDLLSLLSPSLIDRSRCTIRANVSQRRPCT